MILINSINNCQTVENTINFFMKRFCRIFILISLTNIILFSSKGQSAIDYKNYFKVPNVLPPSPDVASLEKFGNIPVSFSTGVPDISIPIWNISCANLKWPISLSYHAGGIRVDEIASSAGLGWSLVGSGVITRAVVGRPDEYETGEPNYSTVNDNNWQYLYNVIDGLNDNELDVFSFNFNGRSGKFVVRQDGSILQIPYSNLKIVNNNLSSFLIIDEQGINYLFDKTETTYTETSSMQNFTYKSSWYLSKVELPDQLQKIEFNYISAGYSVQNFRSDFHSIGQKYVNNNNVAQLTSFNQISFSTTYQQTNALLLSSIVFPNGSLVINYANNRLDKVGTSLQKISDVIVNRNTGSTSYQLKRFLFNTSYFFYRPPNISTDQPTQYRLRLDNINEYGSDNSMTPKVYSFFYNSAPMMPRENFGQDKWGFNNGKYLNTTLLQQQNYTLNGVVYTIGNADRTIDFTSIQACMLNAIVYPTGGKTTFLFEPNQYFVPSAGTILSEQAFALGDMQLIGTKIFSLPSSNVSDVRVKVAFSRYDYPGVTDKPYVTIKDLTTNLQIYQQHNPTASIAFTSDNPINLIPGHSYEIKAYVFSNVSNGQLEAKATVEWKNNTGQPVVESGGGLRIKEIKNFSDDGLLANTETFAYDPAITLTPFNLISQNFNEVVHRLGIGQPAGCIYYEAPSASRIYQSSSIYPISTSMGSAMLYPKVTKYELDANGVATNGKTEYEYDVLADNYLPVTAPYIFNVMLLSNEWKNGYLKSESVFKQSGSGFSLLQKRENLYSEFKSSEVYNLKVYGKYIHTGCWNRGAGSVLTDINYFTYPLRTSSRKLTTSVETIYDGSGQIETVTQNEYGSNLHDFVTKTSRTDSKGQQQEMQYKYPFEYSSIGNLYEQMVNKNLIFPVIEQKVYNGSTLLSTIKNNYRDWFLDGKVIAPETIQGGLLSNSVENRFRNHSYDIYGHQTELSKEDDIRISYLWSYQNQYPIAEVTNASQMNIAYSSFETESKGNWVYNGMSLTDGSAPTGKKVYNLSTGSIAKSGLTPNMNYILSYWTKNTSAYYIPGTISGYPVQGRVVNGWRYFEHKLAGLTQVNIAGSGFIDELRLYPESAQMNTKTYEPLIGITSECDANNRVVYYEYDDFSRLILIRDQEKNIIKKICYNYNGQAENCNVYYNTVQSGIYTKQCMAPATGTSVTYTIPAGTYSSTNSLTEANNKAFADIQANGQAYANATGTCNSPQIMVQGYNLKSSLYQVKFTNTALGTSYTFYLTANSSTYTLGQIPAGTYQVQFYPAGSPVYSTYNINGYTQYGQYGATFNNIQISSTSTAAMY